MPFYRKRPLVVEAVVWTGDYAKNKWPSWFTQAVISGDMIAAGDKDDCLFVRNQDGGLAKAMIGDYVIYTTDHKLLICKPHVFDMTYESCLLPRDKK